MDDKEIRIQIALGTLPTAPGVLAAIIKKTDSVDLLIWATGHRNGRVRAATIYNPLLPNYHFIRMAIFDSTKQVREAVIHNRVKRRESLCKFLNNLVEAGEQLELNFELLPDKDSRDPYEDENTKY